MSKTILMGDFQLELEGARACEKCGSITLYDEANFCSQCGSDEFLIIGQDNNLEPDEADPGDAQPEDDFLNTLLLRNIDKMVKSNQRIKIGYVCITVSFISAIYFFSPVFMMPSRISSPIFWIALNETMKSAYERLCRDRRKTVRRRLIGF